jgi:hypothetical protein
LIVSLPPPPPITSLPADPKIVSLPDPPRIRSMPETSTLVRSIVRPLLASCSTSEPPPPTMCSTLAIDAMPNVSAPLEPSRVSSPAPPSIASNPEF